MSFQSPVRDFSQYDRDRQQGDFHRDIFDSRLDPRLTEQDEAGRDFEELYNPIEHELSGTDKTLFGIRIAIVVFFVILFIGLIIDIVRENLRIKCWRLYLAVSFSVMIWLGLSIYQDHIDEYFVQEISRIPQKRSIYWCFRNLIHGLTLYSIILLLSRLSEYQHRGWWFFIFFGLILVPLIYSIALLIIDLSLDPDKRLSVGWNIAIDTVRVILYNVGTSVICIVFAPKFWTRRQLGTYSNHRPPVTVLISRWISVFLILHNLTAIASYAAVVASRVGQDPEKPVEVHRALEEALLFLLVVCVPGSYVLGMIAGLFCGNDTDDYDEQDMELNKVQFYYPKVWTSDQETQPAVTTSRPPSVTPSRPPSVTGGVATSGVSSNPNIRSKEAPKGASKKPGQGSMESIDFTLAQPSVNGSTYGLALSAAEIAQKKKRNRESYMEAVSMGSVNDIQNISKDGRTSSEPIDL